MIVAKIERKDKRLIPQIPCPLVHPFPILVPTPTNSPPMIITDREELILKGDQVKVPCLKVVYAGEVNWLYNSNDIIDFLNERFS